MNNKDKKLPVKMWIVFLPITILLLLILVLLYNFAITSNQTAKSVIEDDLTIETENLAFQICEELNIMTKMGNAFRDMLNIMSIYTPEEALPFIGTLCENSNAYMVVYCDEDGIGVTQSGIKVNIGKDNILHSKQDTDQYYTYIQKEKIMQAEAIVSVIPVNEKEDLKGYILMYYSVSHLKKFFSQSSIYDNAFLMFSVDNGAIITAEGINEQPAQGTTLPQFLNQMDTTVDAKTILDAMKNLESTSLFLTMEDDSRYVICMPVHIKDWYIAIGFEKTLYDKKLTDEWTSIRNLITYLLILIFVFTFVMIGITILIREIYKKYNKKLQKEADMDLLTELYNKVTTERKIKQYMTECPDSPAILFIVDVDNFKGINDSMGHAAGDEVLKNIGYYMKEEFGEHIVGRIGGDEFILFVEHVQTEHELEARIQKVSEQFQALSNQAVILKSITFSIGAAVFPKDANSFEELYKAADSALYEAKNNGKNQLIQSKEK